MKTSDELARTTHDDYRRWGVDASSSDESGTRAIARDRLPVRLITPVFRERGAKGLRTVSLCANAMSTSGKRRVGRTPTRNVAIP